MAAGIGVDNGGNGLAVAQELLTLDKYRDLQLDGRLRRYDFGGMTTLAVRDGKEVRKRTKEFMTSLISGTLQRRQVVFPAEDLEIEDHSPPTPTRCATAGIYAKGNDHIIDAERCAMLAREQASLDEVSGRRCPWCRCWPTRCSCDSGLSGMCAWTNCHHLVDKWRQFVQNWQTESAWNPHRDGTVSQDNPL